ncbi:MAG TPA: cupin domain-containing protein [Anaerolineae bacterium]|nr:cupin domain-containing protein [Anaerolineae bacterium]
MSDSHISEQEMQSRIVRFAELKQRGVPLMFIDSIIPGHHRMNYAVIGDTASENSEFSPYISQPHKFQIGMVNAPPGNGPAYHTHDYVEMFVVLTGRWRFYWGNEADQAPEGEAILEQWDMISLPPRLWRGFENVSEEHAWIFAVLDPHDVFMGKDPYWAPHVARQAETYGFRANEFGKMIKPPDYEEKRRQVEELLVKGIR